MRLRVVFRRRIVSPSDTSRPPSSTTTADGDSNTEGCQQMRTTAGEATGLAWDGDLLLTSQLSNRQSD